MTFVARSEKARPCPGPPATAMSAFGAKFIPTPSARSWRPAPSALSRVPLAWLPTSTCADGARLRNALNAPPSCRAAMIGAGWPAALAAFCSASVSADSCCGSR